MAEISELAGVETRQDVGRLPKNSVYRSVAGRAEYAAFYDKVMRRLPFPVRTRAVSTRFGRTHLTIGGNPNNPPLIVLPGMSIAGPMMMEFFADYAKTRLLIAPDLIGHPGRSEDRELPLRNHAFGLWLAEVLDGLALKKADMATGSFGSAFALDLAVIAPERLGKLALVVPAGLTPRLPIFSIYLRFFFTWIAYRYLPDKKRLPKIAYPLGRSLTEDNFDYLDIVIRETTFWRHRPAGPFFPKDLAGYREPVFLVSTGQDHLFPPAPTRANAHAALNIAEEVHLPDSAHMPGNGEMAPIHKKIIAFFG